MYTIQDWEDAETIKETGIIAVGVLLETNKPAALMELAARAYLRIVAGQIYCESQRYIDQTVKAIFNDAVVAKLRGEAK